MITQDAYGQGPVRRSITSLRGAVRSGNSGGPMVDADGQVVTTVFAATTSGPRGGFGVPNALVRAALDARRGLERRVNRPLHRAGSAPTLPALMGKTLVIAEKPSVGRDLTRALPGAFQKHEGYLESESHVVTWAVGHLVQLAEPDEYDAKYKKWRMADLPIVPDRFKLVVRDERSRKQMTVITRMLKRDDVDRGRQRVRRRARGRADLRLDLREGGRQEAGAAAVAVVDDDGGDQVRVRLRCGRRRSSRCSSRPRGRARRRTGSSA